MTGPVAEDAWTIHADELPHSGTDEDKLRFAPRYAVLAPSGHNTQPWEFRVRDGVVIDDELVTALGDAASTEGAWLAAVGDAKGKQAPGALVAEANREQFADPAFRGKLASWVWDPDAEDGLLTHGVVVAEAGERTNVLPLRTFEGKARTPASDQELAAGSALLGVIGTAEDDERAWMAAGRALRHVLLRATASSLSASFLNQAIEVVSTCPLVAEAIGHLGYADVVLRLGNGPGVPATCRRSLDDVVVER